MNAQTYEKPGEHRRIKRLSKRLDMNSLVVLKYYKELILFREDVRHQVLMFPSNLSLASQHAVRTLSHRLGLSYRRVARETEQIVVGRLPQKSTKLDVSANSELQDEDTYSESQGWETASSEAEDVDPQSSE
ncbi:hypothetical protein ACHAQJ_003485 [Trichoderma viride]